MVKHQNDVLPKFRNTAAKVAHDIGSSEIAVTRAVQFSRGLEAAEQISPGIKDAVLSGAVKAPKQVIAETHTETHTEAVKTHTGHYNKPQQETTGKPANTLRFNGYKLQTTTRRNKKN